MSHFASLQDRLAAHPLILGTCEADCFDSSSENNIFFGTGLCTPTGNLSRAIPLDCMVYLYRC